MTQSLELNKFGLTDLSQSEMQEINGGTLPWWFPPALVVGLVVSFVNNFGDVVDGIADGWNGTPRH